MQIIVNTDNHIQGDSRITEEAESYVEDAVRHFKKHITRVEVHLQDANSKKSGGHDKRCMMEARIEGHEPVAVSHEAESVLFALDGASERLKSALEHTLGRLNWK
jgi:ribosome-associated translation inhibitor RaiA